MNSPPKALRRLACALVLMAPLAHAFAAGIDRNTINAQYQTDRSTCMGKQDTDARQSCLREAGAARQEALQGKAGDNTTSTDWRRNALARCGVHKDAADRATCERLVNGDGQARGSVDGGGVIREITTEVKPDAAPSR
ncbi:hypothetical protein [Hydrogenophaga sp. RWCD_12]|uniref:hypothetical protein n=1 Tax=Hydrogenophaga sp. RWCD_12 TaxID=3391190 RepID=UPI0039846FFB